MTPPENICSCGASSWCKFFAWRDIVLSVLVLIFMIDLLVRAAPYVTGNPTLIVASSLFVIIPLLGFTMGIFLLKATPKKRVGFFKPWLIIQIVSLVLSVLMTIVLTFAFLGY